MRCEAVPIPTDSYFGLPDLAIGFLGYPDRMSRTAIAVGEYLDFFGEKPCLGQLL